MNFSDLVMRLNVDVRPFTSAMNNARRQVQRFASTIAQVSTDGTASRLVEGYRSLNDRLHNVGLSLRDISRISAGIVVSQTFYGIARSVREATDALWAFNESLDYATVTYSALMGSKDIATDFISTLKQFSVDTIFEYSDIENMSRKLLSYGIEYKNLMFIIEGLTNIGTLSGDSAALERLAVAIGQLNAKGVLQAEEVRQFANAYTPIYDILKEKLGLSEEDFKQIGDLRISSEDAINAIIEYTNEKFGSVADAAMYTITGLNNRIVDTLKVMGADMLQPLTIFYKSLAAYISESLTDIYDIYKTSGLGGVFEYLIPDKEWQHRIRQLLANLSNFIYQIIGLMQTLWPIIRSGIGGLIDGFSILLTVVNAAASVIVGALQSMANYTPIVDILSKALLTAAAAWVIFKVQALGAMVISALKVAIVGVANAVLFLSKAIMANPIVFGLIALSAIMLGVSANANNANSAISNLIKSLNSYSLGGKTADDMLQAGDAMEEGTTNSDQFWESMEDGAEDAEDAVDSAGNAAKKAAKSLLSFDEVFKLNENADAAKGTGGLGNLDGIGDLSDALGGLGQALIPEIPDLSDYAKNFVDTLYNSLWESMKTIASGGATGALIGGLVGFAIGGLITKSMAGALTGAKWGAGIGVLAGAGFAGFWTDTYKEMEGSLQKIAAGSAIGALAGGLLGMVLGAFATKTVDGALTGARYGVMIGSLLGAGLGSFWAVATEEMNSAIEGLVVGAGVGTLAGALAGFIIGAYSTKTLKGAIAGAQLGTKIGAGIGTALGAIFGSLEAEVQRRIVAIGAGASYGALAGGLAGLLLGALATRTMAGAKAGAMLGAKIGGIVGAGLGAALDPAEESIAAALENMFSSVSAAGMGSLIGGLVGMIIGAIVGAFAGGVGAIPGAKAGAMLGSAIGGLGGMVYQSLKDSSTYEGVEQYFEELADAPFEGLTKLAANFAIFMANFTMVLRKALMHLAVELVVGLVNLAVSLIKSITNITTEIRVHLVNFFAGIGKSVVQFGANLIVGVTNFFSNLIKGIVGFFADAIRGILKGIEDMDIPIVSWFAKKLSNLTTWFQDVINSIVNFFGEGSARVVQGFADIGKFVVDWLAGATAKGLEWSGNILNNITDFFGNILAKAVTGFGNVYNAIVSFYATALTALATWFKDITNNTEEWFTVFKADVKAWWESTFNPSAWKSGWNSVVSWFVKLVADIATWFNTQRQTIKSSWEKLFDVSTWVSGWNRLVTWFTNLRTSINTWFDNLRTSVKSFWEGIFNINNWKSGWNLISDWFTSLRTSIKDWFTSIGTSIASWWDSIWDGKEVNVDTSGTGKSTLGRFSLAGHATGGIFNREHIARFAEGNKAEAVIPLQNKSAMQPFVDAISDGIIQGMLPTMVSRGTENTLPPMWVGTLIADERGIEQLFKKFEIYEAKERARKGQA